MVAFPFLLIALGVIVLVFGNRLAVLGAAVGALLGVVLLRFLPGDQGAFLTLGIPIGLAVLGFIGAGFAKGIVALITMILGIVAGVAIVLAVLDLLGIELGFFIDAILALLGGLVGWALVRRFKDLAVIILAGLVGALLVMRGLGEVLPALNGAVATILVIVIAGADIAFLGGFIGGRKKAEVTQT